MSNSRTTSSTSPPALATLFYSEQPPNYTSAGLDAASSPAYGAQKTHIENKFYIENTYIAGLDAASSSVYDVWCAENTYVENTLYIGKPHIENTFYIENTY